MRRYPPIFDLTRGLSGILIDGNLPSSYPNARKIKWRVSIIHKRGTTLLGRIREDDIPMDALEQIKTNDQDNEWGFVWVIMSGLDSKSPFLESVKVNSANIYRKLAETQTDKEIAEAKALVSERKAMALEEEIAEKHSKVTEKLFPRREFYKKYLGEGED